jgi:branched-chain amino acid transport system substrate-binding protein
VNLTVRAEVTPIRIGAILILSGSEAMYGEAFREGIAVALDEVNAAGGVGGRPLQVIIEDSANNAKRSHTAAVKLIEHDKVIAVLNSSFTEVMANGPLLERAKIPAVTLWDSAIQIEELGEYNFGIGVYTPSAGEKAAEFSREKLAAKTAVIINMENEWGNTISKVFTQEFESRGGKILEYISVDPSTTDFRAILTKAKRLNPDVMYTPLVEGVIPFYKQVRQLGVKAHIVTSDIISNHHIKEAPGIFEGVYQTQPPAPEGAVTQLFTALYKRKYGHAPPMLLFNALGYDGLKLLVRAIELTHGDPVKMKAELHQTRSYQGASGIIDINERGSSPKLEEMVLIKHGTFVPMERCKGKGCQSS